MAPYDSFKVALPVSQQSGIPSSFSEQPSGQPPTQPSELSQKPSQPSHNQDPELPPLNRGIKPALRAQICLLLTTQSLSHKAIATRVGVSPRTVERLHHNLVMHGSVRKPRYAALGRSRKLNKQVQGGWRQQEEIVAWLLAEHRVVVSRPTVSRVLKRRGWTEKGVLKIRGARAKGMGKEG
ncbi:hypothetical protein BJX66DRAFT_345788 [Aspergillus keveii]|uniref:Transposase Tc1-like domain-containing protein n=1 Tax=Aspergillus keveii TaxID=714993 RepID=A0ABR4FGV6_9EURO